MISRIKTLTHKALSNKVWPFTFVFVLVVLTLLRITNMELDPPPELSISAAPFTDEGLKTYSPRNFHYYNEWRWTTRDGYAGWHKSSPLAVKMYIAWFDLFGVSFVSIRSLNILFSVLTLVLLFMVVMRYYRDRFTAFAAMILYGISYYLMMFNRLAFFENMLVFFSLLIFSAFCELFQRRSRMKRSVTDESIRTLPQFLYMLIAVAIGCIATVAGIFTKQSIVVIIIAIVPFLTLYFFYSHRKLNKFLINKFYITIALIVVGYMLLGHFGWLDRYFKSLLKIRIFDVSIGYLLPLKRSTSNFDPVYMSFLKSLYLEFVYLQPVIFFTGIFYAVKTYYNFLYKSKLDIIDTAFSTWVLFGFMFLAIMRYHPARYYTLLSVPLVILSARFFTSSESFSFKRIVPEEKIISLRKLILFLFWFYLFFYTGVVMINSFMPFDLIKNIYSLFFYSIISKEYGRVVPIVMVAVVFQIAVFTAMYFFVRRIRPSFNSKKYSYIIFLCIIVFQSYQYGRWLLTSDYTLANFSRRMGEVLPENSVITGCWAASLSLNNTLRALVIQDKLHYNVDLINDIIADRTIPVVTMKNGGVQRTEEKDMPVYLFVSTTGPFDMKIRRTFSKYMTDERHICTLPMGLYDVEMYRLDAKPDPDTVQQLGRAAEQDRKNTYAD